MRKFLICKRTSLHNLTLPTFYCIILGLHELVILENMIQKGDKMIPKIKVALTSVGSQKA